MLLAKKVIILAKYLDFADGFLKKLAIKLSKRSIINKYSINLESGKQLFYRPIYCLGLVELEIFKIYIETNLANNFIRLSKSPAGAFILFVQKPDSSLHLCVNY